MRPDKRLILRVAKANLAQVRKLQALGFVVIIMLTYNA